jgi:uncharacterized membrane protein HdeD (DUF308 family)
MIIVGLFAIILPAAATLAIEILIGWILVIGGIFKLIHAFGSRRWGKTGWSVLISVIYIIAGILLLTHPLRGVLTLTLLLALLFILEGIFQIIISAQLRAVTGRGWLTFNGVLALIIGLLIWSSWPSSAAWAIGLLVGINILFGGLTLIMAAPAVEKLRQ